MKNKSYVYGFTLIDILISAAIVSFLSSIILFNISEGKVKAQDAQMKMESAQVSNAIEIYKTSNNGKTPIANLTVSGGLSPTTQTGKMYTEGSDEYIEVMNKLVENRYLSAIPKSVDGISYAYGESVDGTEAVFAARLRSSRSISDNTRNSCNIIAADTPTQEYQTFTCDYQMPILGANAVPGTRGGPPPPKIIMTPALFDCANALSQIQIAGYSHLTCTYNPGYIPPICTGTEITQSDRATYCSPLNNPQVQIANYSCPIPMSDPGVLCNGSDFSEYCTCI